MKQMRMLLFTPIIVVILASHTIVHAPLPPQRDTQPFDSQQILNTQVTVEQFFVNVIHHFAAIINNPYDSFERGKNVFSIILHVVHFAFGRFYHRSSHQDQEMMLSDDTLTTVGLIASAHQYSFMNATNELADSHVTRSNLLPFDCVYQELLIEQFEQFTEHFLAIMQAPDDKDHVAKHLSQVIESARGITTLAFATGNYGASDLARGMLPFDESTYNRMGNIITSKCF